MPKIIRRLRFKGKGYSIVEKTDNEFISVDGDIIPFSDYYKFRQHKKLDEKSRSEVLELLKKGESIASVAKKYDATPYSVNAIMEGWINEHRKNSL